MEVLFAKFCTVNVTKHSTSSSYSSDLLSFEIYERSIFKEQTSNSYQTSNGRHIDIFNVIRLATSISFIKRIIKNQFNTIFISMSKRR